ncbi:hypothetical protein [Priestia abyssalis]|uniref:hypothetical protein n=1 Tax=Priestia abyssalis TaxID=1221450 RepID=UPI0009955E98|nr:hypothetical protein [Priestia abyssalis]
MIELVEEEKRKRTALLIGLIGNAANLLPEMQFYFICLNPSKDFKIAKMIKMNIFSYVVYSAKKERG